jgi:hypothetical protein
MGLELKALTSPDRKESYTVPDLDGSEAYCDSCEEFRAVRRMQE